MPAASTIDLLNRLLAIHNRSLANYLVDATPWAPPGSEQALRTLKLIVEDQQGVVDRLASMILDAGGEVETGEYPIHFTRYNDLSIKFLIGEILAAQAEDVARIERCVEELGQAPMAKAVAQESLGAALGHLDSLRELLDGDGARLASHATV